MCKTWLLICGALVLERITSRRGILEFLIRFEVWSTALTCCRQGQISSDFPSPEKSSLRGSRKKHFGDSKESLGYAKLIEDLKELLRRCPYHCGYVKKRKCLSTKLCFSPAINWKAQESSLIA